MHTATWELVLPDCSGMAWDGPVVTTVCSPPLTFPELIAGQVYICEGECTQYGLPNHPNTKLMATRGVNWVIDNNCNGKKK